MKRLGVLSLVGVMAILLAWVAAPGSTGANPDIEVNPSEYDFGQVELGSSKSTDITLVNVWYGPVYIHNVSFLTGSSPDFSFDPLSLPITLAPMLQNSPGSTLDVQVTFTPSAPGYASAQLVIGWSNGEIGYEYVTLDGTGVEASGQPVTIANILAFYDESVADGTLYGSGSGQSADGRLNALRNMIEAAGDLIEAGDYEAACEQLWAAFDRCDSRFPPPEFVEGPDAMKLNCMILALIEDLGCV